MRFTSLIVELIRARPRLTVWVVLLVQAAIWFAIPTLLYGSPPGNLATVIAFGRECQVGTDLGPPLAFWLADLAYRLAGHHMAGVYLLAQLCFIATFWILFLLGRALVGGPHAVIAVLLTMAITTYGWAGIEFGPAILARPIWALTLLQCWRVIGQNRRSAWFGLAIAAGLLLLTTADAPWLLLLLVLFMLAIGRGRRKLLTFDPIYAVLIAVTLAVPWLTWLNRTGGLEWSFAALRTPLSALDLQTFQAVGARALLSLLLLWLTTAGIAVLAIMNAARFVRRRELPPVILRAGTEEFAKRFVFTFAIVPPVAGCLVAAAMGRSDVVGGAGIALLMVGLAVVMATGDAIPLRRQRLLRRVWALVIVAPAFAALASLLVAPWLSRTSQASAIPASEVARFFADNFQRRTGKPLPAVAGDPEIAALVTLGATRPHLLIDAAPKRTPWMTPARFAETGGVVVWRATDTIGAPPADLAERFPNLVPELPHAFESWLTGRQDLVRIGWAIVRPKS
jgi:hypothetical protein